MDVEHAEKTRSEIRAIKILLGLLELGHVFYIIGIVIKNATSFMLQVFDFMQRRARTRFEEERVRLLLAGGQGRQVLGLARLGPVCPTFCTPCFLFAPPWPIFLYFAYFLFLMDY